jgi:hypothetical protein
MGKNFSNFKYSEETPKHMKEYISKWNSRSLAAQKKKLEPKIPLKSFEATLKDMADEELEFAWVSTLRKHGRITTEKKLIHAERRRRQDGSAN